MSSKKLGNLKFDRVLQKQLKQLAKKYLAYRVWNIRVIFIELQIPHLKDFFTSRQRVVTHTYSFISDK